MAPMPKPNSTTIGSAAGPRWLALWVAVVCLGVAVWPAGAQEAAPPPATSPPESQPPATQPTEIVESTPTDLAVESIQARLAQIEAAPDLNETTKTELTGLYRQALDQLSLAATWSAKIAEYQRGREEAPQVLEALRQSLAQAASRPTTAPRIEVPADATLEQLSQRLAEAEADLKVKKEAADRLELEAKTRSERTTAIPDLLADANARLQRITQDAGAPPPTGASPQLTMARRTLGAAQKQAVGSEIQAYEEELRFYAARGDVLAARREKARLDVKEAQARAAAWQQAVSDRRQAEVERQRRQAEEEAQTAPPAVQELAEGNRQLADERVQVARDIDAAKAAAGETKELGERLARQFRHLQENADRVGMADLIGALMRQQRAELNALRRHDRDYVEVKQKFERVQLRLPQIEEERLALADMEDEVAAVLRQLTESGVMRRPRRLEPKIRELYAARRDLLDGLQRDYAAYSTNLVQWITAESALLNGVNEFGRFIAQRVLWVRSSAPVYAMRVPADAADVALGLLGVAGALARDLLNRPTVYALAAVGLSLLLASRRRLRHRLADIRGRVAKVHTDSAGQTLVALVSTGLLVLPWPGLLAFLAWRLPLAAEAERVEVYPLAQAMSAGLRAAAAILLTIAAVWHVTRADGLALTHFRWDAATVRLVRRHLTWLAAFTVPARFLVGLSEQLPDDAWRDSAGRIGLIVGMLATAVFVQRVLRPVGGLLTPMFQRASTGWAYRFRYVWYTGAVSVPLLLALASAAGYHYTAVQLAARCLLTVWLGLGLVLLHALLSRALLLAQRRIAIEQARKKRAALAEAKPEAGADAVPVEEETVSVVQIGEQTRRLLRTVVVVGLVAGLWLTWADMLPALSFMHDVRLWSYAAPAEAGTATGAAATVRYVTLAHVALAVLIGLVTGVLARNIPGLLEIAILRRLEMDAGGRFAATTIARYLVIALGLIAAFNAVGIGWSKVQWLVAAVSVGLGFGLQEVFANFVSGLMLLFERPIRIGDTVTVGNTSGTVTRIRIRATTIMDWDRKELIIPNKEFITGQVVNWTLSDSTSRIILPVGIAYGSDVDHAEQLLYQVARDNPDVLAEPEPRVFFMGFGDSALNFELRVFVGSLDVLLSTRHALNKAIDREFRAAGIEIAFPQRDLHIRSIQRPPPRRQDR